MSALGDALAPERVRSGSIASIWRCPRYFPLYLELGHCSMQSACLKGATFRLMHRGNGSSFNHLVGASEQRKRYGQTERLGAFQIQKQLYFRG
jgi:hypothetical protein